MPRALTIRQMLDLGHFSGGAFGMPCEDDYPKIAIYRIKRLLRSRDPYFPDYEWYAFLRLMLREKLKNARPRIDDADPWVPTSFAISYQKFNERLANFIRIEKENAKLLTRLYDIHVNKAFLDTSLPKEISTCLRNNGIQRRNEILEIMFQNVWLYRRLQNVKPVYSRKKQLEEFEVNRKHLRRLCKFPLWTESRVCAPHEHVAHKRAQRFPRDRVYLDIEVEDTMSFRIIIELFSDITPMAAENFRCLCTGLRRVSLRCVHFDRILPGLFWRAQTIKLNNIYGSPFPPENFRIKHNEEGLISMPCFGSRGIRTEFIITLRPLQCLDGDNLVVGKIIYGMDYLKKATHKCKPNKARHGVPGIPVMIMKSGEVSDMSRATAAKPLLFNEILEQVIRAKVVTEGDAPAAPAAAAMPPVDIKSHAEAIKVEDDEDLYDFTPTSSYSDL